MHVFDALMEPLFAAPEARKPAVEGHAPLLAFSVGIDVGDLLLLETEDCFGDAVNLAYKLGEDIARPGEVMVT